MLMPGDESDPKFLSTLSHDLRGGLHSVQLALDLLRRNVLDGRPMEQLLADVELARWSLLDAGARAERIICAERIRRGVMPVRVGEGDLVPTLQHVVRVAAGEAAAGRVRLDLPPRVMVRTDLRLAGEIAAGLLDHALRTMRGASVWVVLDAGGLLEVSSDRSWIDGSAAAMLSVATVDPPFAEPSLGLYVAAGAARLLGSAVRVISDRAVSVSLTAAPAAHRDA
ncbi:MAG: hypothetical protein NZ561_04925 [Phycisphaerae bacterium]|nr:hypothetical protein [Phycisphaerae bacterium]MDW8262849.1 hypothetical protein [Phycisphaerales bacterium]